MYIEIDDCKKGCKIESVFLMWRTQMSWKWTKKSLSLLEHAQSKTSQEFTLVN